MTTALLYPVRDIGSTTPEFRRRLREVAASLAIDPTDIAAILSFESHFNPRARNPYSGATGILQWMPDTAIAMYRLTVQQIADLSAVAQLDLVERYFWGVRGKGYDLHQLYMLVWNGSPADPSQVLGVADASGHPGAVYRDNSNLDLNHDGRITAGEASWIVRQLAAQARKLPPLKDDDPKATALAATSDPSSGPLFSSGSYRVAPGDTPALLASRFAGRRGRRFELYHCNSRATIDVLRAGAVIQLPEGWHGGRA